MVQPTLTELPSGVVTFVFTDIEGSTRMLAALGDRYADVLEQHNEVLRRVWPRHGGREVNTEGDAFFVAFQQADAAVSAAIEAQQAIADEAWPRGMELRIRIGIHSGFARPRGRDYIALAVNQAARIVGTAHGGQVLLSQEAADQLTPTARAAVASVGLHRVRDFDHPQLLHRVVADGWVDPGRPPRARPAQGHNLRQPTTSLVDREDDRAWLQEHLTPGAVLTLVGPGGIGKTRLAIEAGLAVADRWADGVWLVDLGAVQSVDLVAEALVDALGALRTPGMSTRDEALQHLEQRSLVVVLDNCEHVIAAVADLVDRLAPGCPEIAFLATSRRPLGLRSEQVRRLAPLGDGAAVELFDQRAGDVGADPEATAALCRELDGVPLAIELAAAHARVLPPASILARLRTSPAFLHSRDPGLPDRQRSLHALLGASLELLDVRHGEVLRRVAIHPGSFDVALAQIACHGLDLGVADIEEVLWRLVEESLVVPDTEASATRFRLPRTLRAVVADELDVDDRAAAVRASGEWFGARLGPERATGHAWTSDVALDLPNLRASIDALAQIGEVRLAQRLAWSIARFHELRSEYRTGIEELTAHLLVLREDSSERVGMQTRLADLSLRVQDLAAAERALDAAADLRRQVGDPAWDGAGWARARGEVALRRGRHGEALRWVRQALADAGGPRDRARAWSLAGTVDHDRGDWSSAVHAFEAELADAEAAAMETFLAKTHGNLGEVHLRLGNAGAAARHQAACLAIGRANGEPVMVAFSVMVAARLLAGQGDPRAAARLHVAANHALAASGFVLLEADAVADKRVRDELVQALGETEFDAAERAGRQMSFAEAADAALGVLEAVAD